MLYVRIPTAPGHDIPVPRIVLVVISSYLLKRFQEAMKFVVFVHNEIIAVTFEL